MSVLILQNIKEIILGTIWVPCEIKFGLSSRPSHACSAGRKNRGATERLPMTDRPLNGANVTLAYGSIIPPIKRDE